MSECMNENIYLSDCFNYHIPMFQTSVALVWFGNFTNTLN